MQQTISPATFGNTFPAYAQKTARVSAFRRFIAWCDEQEKNRLLWLGLSIIGHIGMIVPLTLLSILFLADNNFALWTVVLCANMPVLALNLAAQPTKVTIPVMLVSLLVNISVSILSVVLFFL